MRVQVFLDPQRDVSFTGATGHDELATVSALQPLHNGAAGFNLMIARCGWCFASDLRQLAEVGGIRQHRALKIGQQKTYDGLFLRFANLLCIAANIVCRGY